MLKKYQIGISVFFLLALSATLLPPFQWGNERLRTQRERQTTVPITATLEGQRTPHGTSAERVFPIEQRCFVFGRSWSKVQIGWGWEITPKAKFDDSLRSVFYDSLFKHFDAEYLYQWIYDEQYERLMALPVPQNRKAHDYFYRVVSIPYLSASYDAQGWLTKKFFDEVCARRQDFFQYRPDGRLWLSNFRREHPEYQNLSDTLLCAYIIGMSPRFWLIDDDVYAPLWQRNSDYAREKDVFLHDMRIDSVRQKRLSLYMQLGLIRGESLTKLDSAFALTQQRYYSSKVYDYLHRELDLGTLILDYLIIFLIAVVLELGRHLFAPLILNRRPQKS